MEPPQTRALTISVRRSSAVLKCCTAFRFPGRAVGIEAVDVQIDLIAAEEGAEDVGHRTRQRAVRRRVFRVIRCREKRPPARLLDGCRVPVVVARHRAVAVRGDRRRVDRGDGAPNR